MIVSALLISLKISITSILLSSMAGIALARILYKRNNVLRSIIENILLIPIFLPPSIVGYILLVVIGRNGVLGSVIYGIFESGIIFTWWAGVLATFIMSLPIVYQNSKAAFFSINHDCEEAAKVDGAGRLQIFMKVTIPMASKGLLAGIILGFARAFGEFGATIMVAGNIPGRTQTLPIAMYYAVEGGNKILANQILAVVLIISFSLIALFNYFSRNTEE
ncbi:MAG: molybdate ABC transporter permease subunit [Bacillota bacterium]